MEDKTKPTIYTKDFVQSELLNMLNDIKADKDIIFIGQLFESRPYSRQRYSEWATEFKNCQEISDIINKIETILETRINVGAINNKLNPAMVIFNLKNKYGWKDENHNIINGNLAIENLSKTIEKIVNE